MMAADRLLQSILIRSRDGGTEWIRVSEEPWWEAEQLEEIAELERKMMPVQVRTFEL
jgi:hypothetical protein